jgi:hypothetical protein
MRRLAALVLGALVVSMLGPARAAEIPVDANRYLRCRADQLGALPWTHRAYGHDIPGIALRNMSLSICRIWGIPSVTVYDSDGKPVKVTFTRKVLFDKQPDIVYAIAPSQAVFFAFYGQAGNGPFDRSCALYNQLGITPASADAPIPLTMNAGTCGHHFTISQVFPVAELSSTSYWSQTE